MSSDVVLRYGHNDQYALRLEVESYLQAVNMYAEGAGVTLKIGLGPAVARRLAANLNAMADEIERDIDRNFQQSTYLRAHPDPRDIS